MFEIASSRTTPTTTNQTELDSHADTSVAGANFRTPMRRNHLIKSRSEPPQQPGLIGMVKPTYYDLTKLYCLATVLIIRYYVQINYVILEIRSMMFQFSSIETQRTPYYYDLK